ncbi:ABC transporter substrate-binding protein [Lactovum odontotermitis]
MRKGILTLFAAALTTAALLGLSACSSSSGSDQKSGGSIKLQLIAKGFQNDYWKAVQSGAQAEAKKEGVSLTFTGPKDETAVADQLQMLNNAINQKPSAIGLAALDTNSEIDAIKQAQDLEIPIIGFDSGVPGAPKGAVKATASTNNEKAAAAGADKMYEQLKEKIADTEEPVRIGVVSAEVNSLSLSNRTKGFIDEMIKLLKTEDKIGNKIAVIGNSKFEQGSPSGAKAIIELRVPAQMTDSAGQTEAQTLLNKADTIGIFATNEFGAKAIINADNAAGGKIGSTVDKIIAVGFDSGTLQRDAVKNGKFLGSITQDPITIGKATVELAVKTAKGEKVEDIDTGSHWYDKNNIDSEEIAALLYK